MNTFEMTPGGILAPPPPPPPPPLTPEQRREALEQLYRTRVGFMPPMMGMVYEAPETPRERWKREHREQRIRRRRT